MPKELHEFYCNDCDGYIRIKINTEWQGGIQVVCPGPGCTRKHPRMLRDGRIVTGGGGPGSMELTPPKSAYHKEPLGKIRRDARESMKVER